MTLSLFPKIGMTAPLDLPTEPVRESGETLADFALRVHILRPARAK